VKPQAQRGVSSETTFPQCGHPLPSI
jgi:hypothetical protein